MSDVPEIGLAAALDAAKDTREYRAGIAFDVPADGLEQYTAAVIRAAAPIIARQVAEQIEARILPLRDTLPSPLVGEPMSSDEAAEWDAIGQCARVAREVGQS